jgi:rhodanese-related sulfurtransferase
MNRVLLSAVFFLFLFGCSTTGEGYMQQNELLARIEKNQSPIIVDVRSSSEYQAGHVPGAIHIPFWTAFTTDKMENYEKNKDIVLYCEHGPRAGIAKFALMLAGFENISYLAGHMIAWKKTSLPVDIAEESE